MGGFNSIMFMATILFARLGIQLLIVTLQKNKER
jgi:hypothetical protein